MEKNFTIKGKQIACTLEGDPKNPAIILIHDLASHRGVWRSTLAALQEKYYCIAIDLLGFGASDKQDGSDYSLSAQSQRILLLADQLGLKNFSLIGHSMGGQISLYIASVLAPQRVSKLVIVSGVITGRFSERVEKVNLPLIRTGRKWPWLYGLARVLINFGPYVNIVFKPWFYDVKSIPFKNWETDRIVASNPACAVSYDESLKAISSLDTTQYLRKVKVKTLLISGKQDGAVSVDQALLAQTLIPNNDLALIEKCGHFPMYEKPGPFLKSLALIF